MKKDDFNQLIDAMKEWLNPDGPHQKKILHGLSISPVALKIDYAEAEPDGDFEILFVESCKAEESKDKFSKYGDVVTIISFEQGMQLSQRSNCCGGDSTFKQGQKLLALNPSLRSQFGGPHYIM